jgi:RNA polymerase sigma factor (sigma-70 family)
MAKDELAVLSDQELWCLFREGRAAAVSVLFRRHYRELYGYGVKISRNQSLTKDCLQEMFGELWDKHETLSPVSHVRAYLLKILRRKIFHHLQQTARQSAREGESLPEFEVVLSPETLLVQEQLSDETLARLNAALQKLTPRQREVIYLRFFDALSCEAISEIIPLRYQSVVNLIHESIKKLREHMHLVYKLLLLLIGVSDTGV